MTRVNFETHKLGKKHQKAFDKLAQKHLAEVLRVLGSFQAEVSVELYVVHILGFLILLFIPSPNPKFGM